MMIRLSDKEASILLGATLMHWGVPFRHAARRALAEQQQTLVDEASDRLVALRESYRHSHTPESLEVTLSDQETILLIMIVEDCLNECGDDSAELDLQLNTRQRSQVEALLGRLRAALGSRYATIK
jgi:hypothetical protein